MKKNWFDARVKWSQETEKSAKDYKRKHKIVRKKKSPQKSIESLNKQTFTRKLVYNTDYTISHTRMWACKVSYTDQHLCEHTGSSSSSMLYNFGIH